MNFYENEEQIIKLLKSNTDYDWNFDFSPNYYRVWVNGIELDPISRYDPIYKMIGFEEMVVEAENALNNANPTHIYLDDERVPKTKRDWTIIRNPYAFEKHINKYTPSVVSLDHDLGFKQTGLYCVHRLIDVCQKTGEDPSTIEFNIHSANPVGRDNMDRLWKSWLKFYKEHNES